MNLSRPKNSMSMLMLLALAAISASSSQAQETVNVAGGCAYNRSTGRVQGITTYGFPNSISFPYVQVKKAAGYDREESGPLWALAVDGSNAWAVIDPGGYRYILVGEDWFKTLNQRARSEWPAYAILAHEFGHHENNDHLRLDVSTREGRAKSRARELQADYYSGELMCKMGLSLSAAQSAVRLFGDPGPDSTHPRNGARVSEIESGWRKCKQNDLAPKPPQDAASCFPVPISIGEEMTRRMTYTNRCNEAVRVMAVMSLDQSGSIAGFYDISCNGDDCIVPPQRSLTVDLGSLGVPEGEGISLTRSEYYP